MQEQKPMLMYSTLDPKESFLQPFASFHGDFSDEECKKIIEYGNSLEKETAAIGSGNEGKNNKNIRDSDISWITPTEEIGWLFEKLRHIIIGANKECFGFELYGFYEAIQFTRYEAPSGKYNKHIDTGPGKITRKLSVTVQLSDSDDYEGGDLLIYDGPRGMSGDKKRGTITIFPSFMLHEVTPVTKGTRYSLVTWIGGPAFK